MTLSLAFPAISAAFLASLVEAVEAATIVLAVATVRGWRSAAVGVIVLNRISRELAGLFVDDGRLAIFVLGVVTAAAIASLLSGLWGGCVLLGGSLCTLYVNVIGTIRSSRRAGHAAHP